LTTGSAPPAAAKDKASNRLIATSFYDPSETNLAVATIDLFILSPLNAF